LSYDPSYGAIPLALGEARKRKTLIPVVRFTGIEMDRRRRAGDDIRF
jgi:hypothetical protein